ncbi:unnamed protein product [Ceutorhynchus assimilis]|uniref:Uncharacterized protein n=1 Tax=Ceutorhynchus assimilis TaxID=467358 RepID=A0A9N9MQ98_9CUCU|nr:unnamed protein product [Ceutorhynchus assimilis]
MMIFPEISSSITKEPNVTTTSTAKPEFEGDDAKYLIVPLVVIVVVMLLSLLVYCMAKRRKMDRLRRDIAKLYEYDEKDLEWEPLNSFEFPLYNSGDLNPAFSRRSSFKENYMPTTNL